jgi:Golgi SNAP receptor complex protein 1
VLSDLWSEHRKQDAAHRARAATAALLGPRRTGPGGAEEDTSAADLLLRERGSLQRSSAAVDDLLSQASATTEMLAAQRAIIGAAAGRLGGFVTRVPGASAVIGAIGARRTRNDTIVGLVMAACVCFSVYYVFLRKT